MRANAQFWISSTIILGTLFLWSSYNIFHYGDARELKNIAVILNDDSNDRYTFYRRGMEQAAEDYHMKLSFRRSNRKTKAVKKALEKDVSGIILEPDMEKKLPQILEENASTTRFVLLDSDIEPQGIYPSVEADNGKIASLLMKQIKDDLENEGTDISGRRIAVVYFSPRQLSVMERRNAFIERMDQNGMSLAIEISGEEGMEDKLRSMLYIGGVDMVAALDNPATEACANLINRLELGGRLPLYGVGYSAPAVYFTDRGVVNALVIPNEYQIGYLAVERLRQLILADTGRLRSMLSTRMDTTEDESIELNIISKEVLFQTKTEPAAFPMQPEAISGGVK